jgi:hypothetical protein
VRAARRPWSRPLLSVALCLGLTIPGTALALSVEQDILTQTAQVRGLTPKQEVPFAVVDAAKLKADLLQSYEDPKAVAEIEISRKLLVILGLLSPDTDLHGMLVTLYAENILGYYNHNDKKMYLVSGKTDLGPSEKITLAHEFTHALQDQYFDLGKVSSLAGENGDYAAAIQGLVEGDATMTMILYARNNLSQREIDQVSASGDDSSIDRAPLVIRDEVIFPYREGALFAISLWRDGGYDAVNRAFARPPRSTEQIIHPEKYIAGDQPVEVTLPDLAAVLGPGWRQRRSDVLGELDLRILLEQYSDPIAAGKGSTGWGGDRYVYLENAAGQGAVALGTVWDTQQDAVEFFDSYAATIATRFGGRAQRTVDTPTRIAWSTPNGSIQLQRSDARVALALAPDDGSASALITAMAPGAAGPSQQPLPPAPVPAPRQAPVQVPG